MKGLQKVKLVTLTNLTYMRTNAMYTYVHFCTSRSVSVLLNRLLKVYFFDPKHIYFSWKKEKIWEEAGKIENYILAKHFTNYEQNYLSNESSHYHNFNFDLSPIKRMLILRSFFWIMSYREQYNKEKSTCNFQKKRGKTLYQEDSNYKDFW